MPSIEKLYIFAMFVGVQPLFTIKSMHGKILIFLIFSFI